MLNTTHHRSAANTTQSTGGGGWAGAGYNDINIIRQARKTRAAAARGTCHVSTEEAIPHPGLGNNTLLSPAVWHEAEQQLDTIIQNVTTDPWTLNTAHTQLICPHMYKWVIWGINVRCK